MAKYICAVRILTSDEDNAHDLKDRIQDVIDQFKDEELPVYKVQWSLHWEKS